MSQDWDNLLFKLSLAEALEEVATSITEEAWLYNEYAIYIGFDYIHWFNLCSLIRISKIIPSFFVDKASCARQFESEFSLHSLASFFPIKEGIFLPLRLSCKESSTFLTKPLFPQEREDVADYAIASARVLVSSAKPVPKRTGDDCLRNRIASICRQLL